MQITSPDLCPCKIQKGASLQLLLGISVLIFGTSGNIRPTASECKVQSSFPCWVPPQTGGGVRFTSLGLYLQSVFSAIKPASIQMTGNVRKLVCNVQNGNRGGIDLDAR